MATKPGAELLPKIEAQVRQSFLALLRDCSMRFALEDEQALTDGAIRALATTLATESAAVAGAGEES